MKYARGKNPNSIAALTMAGKGRRQKYASPKESREVTVTKEGWEGAKAIAAELGCSGISDLIEKIGRGEIKAIAIDRNKRL